MDIIEKVARDFLSENVLLEKVKLSELPNAIYWPDTYENKENCTFFRFKLFQAPRIGSAKYIAVPNNGSKPYYLGELGE
ncbi:hypothetical protein [Thalassotalea sp. ND16A]|uniref:hypothetical protein n=1 Tax=Thalassotalea sp. ND16A TaxID=1535422 RepID=UPI00051A4D89|nr:hypothetical protein [Thalassotalea sp. ND16A]